jgi:hypothetical protein
MLSLVGRGHLVSEEDSRTLEEMNRKATIATLQILTNCVALWVISNLVISNVAIVILVGRSGTSRGRLGGEVDSRILGDIKAKASATLQIWTNYASSRILLIWVKSDTSARHSRETLGGITFGWRAAPQTLKILRGKITSASLKIFTSCASLWVLSNKVSSKTGTHFRESFG